MLIYLLYSNASLPRHTSIIHLLSNNFTWAFIVAIKSVSFGKFCFNNKQQKMSRAAKIAAVARDIFGTLPNRNVRTGMQFLKKPLTGAYEARYYMESIEPYARKVS